MKNVYIIIVTYNAMRWIKQCLDSSEGYNVIVVDNASTDNTIQYIYKNYSHVTVLPQKENLGFGKGNNIGISYALKHFSAEYVFLLNQDAYLVDSVIEDLIYTHKNNTSYGILSPLHITRDKKLLDKKFAEYISKDKDEGFNCIDVLKSKLKIIYDVSFVNAAGWLISRDCLLNVGGFDPMFFLYGEDDNLCQRVLYHGYEIGVVANTFMIHDRAQRKQEPIDHNFERFLKIQANIYKTQYANINNPDAVTALQNKINYLKRQYLKCLLTLNFKNFKKEYSKYQLLVKNRTEIESSYLLNKIKAPHYLSL